MSNIKPEELSRCLFENSNDAFFVFDPDGYRVLDANPTAERLTGLPCKQLVGMTLSELLLADEGYSLEKLIQAYQSTGVFHSQEGYRLHSEKGDSSALNISVSRIHTSPKPLGLVVACDITKRKQALRTAKDELADSSVPVRDGTGRVTGSLGILQDVTERKQSEVELRESEERLGLAMRGTSDGLWDSDLATGQEYWSPRFREMVEYDEDELEATYDSFLYMLHPDDKQRTQELVRRHLKENEPYDIDFRLRRKSGEFAWFQSRGQVVRDETGQPIRMVGSIRDITDRKQAEEALRKSEERFCSVFEQAGVAVGVVESQTGRFVQINSKYEELIGYSNEEMTKKTWMEISHPDDIEEDLQKNRDLIEGEINRFSLEKRLIHKDGSMIWINLTVSPIGDSEEIPQQHIVIVEDITERKRLEEEAHEHRERLAHVTRLSTLGEMATGLAHEINQPLAGISTYSIACLLLLRATDPFPEREKLIDILGKIEVQSRRAGEIIHGLRKLVAKRESVHTSFSINQPVDNALALTESETRTQDIHVRRELASDLPRIHGDEIQIEQVILNLVCNAIEALRESESNRREISVRTSQDEQLIVVDICDTGPGINADDVERVLDAFVSTKDEGMGLGLSISRSIVEAHGGRLWAEPNSDCGVTFYFNLPTSQNADS